MRASGGIHASLGRSGSLRPPATGFAPALWPLEYPRCKRLVKYPPTVRPVHHQTHFQNHQRRAKSTRRRGQVLAVLESHYQRAIASNTNVIVTPTRIVLDIISIYKDWADIKCGVSQKSSYAVGVQKIQQINETCYLQLHWKNGASIRYFEWEHRR